MKIDLANFFNGSESKKKINYNLKLEDFDYFGYNPINQDVVANGEIYSKAEIVYLNLNIDFVFDGICDRCAESVEKKLNVSVNKILVEKLENEYDDDDYIIVNNRTLDIDELINEEVSLSLPSKLLCKDDCKGLCQKCGTNLNVNSCDCKPDVDPRMSALLQLLD